MRKILAVLSVLAALLLVEGVVLAVEHITNGTFDADVSGWTPSTGTIVYTTTQSHNAVGSAQIANTSSSTSSSSFGAYQCVDIPTSNSGDTFTARGWVYVPSDVPANFQSAYIRVRYYAANNCGTSIGSNIDSAIEITTTASWQEVTTIAPVPATAESVQVRLYVRKANNTANPYVYFDDVTFYDSTATDVTVSSIQSSSPFLNLAAMFAVAAGLVVLRKRR